MKVNNGDLVTVHYDHANGSRESEAGVVVNAKQLHADRSELWLHPGELEGAPAAVIEVIFGAEYPSHVKRARRKEQAVLFDKGQFCDACEGFTRKRVTDRVSDPTGANVTVKKVSGDGPTTIYADAISRGDRMTYVH